MAAPGCAKRVVEKVVRLAQTVEDLFKASFVAEKDAPQPPMNAASTIPKNESPLSPAELPFAVRYTNVSFADRAAIRGAFRQ